MSRRPSVFASMRVEGPMQSGLVEIFLTRLDPWQWTDVNRSISGSQCIASQRIIIIPEGLLEMWNSDRHDVSSIRQCPCDEFRVEAVVCRKYTATYSLTQIFPMLSFSLEGLVF